MKITLWQVMPLSKMKYNEIMSGKNVMQLITHIRNVIKRVVKTTLCQSNCLYGLTCKQEFANTRTFIQYPENKRIRTLTVYCSDMHLLLQI